MLTRILHLFLMLLTVSFNCKVSAQSQPVAFREINGTSGATIGKIGDITQDKYGFIWLANNTDRCIIRYDGSYMERFTYNPDLPNSLGGYYPECLYTDSTGLLWIGFYGQGLDVYDIDANSFKHYRHDANDAESLANDFVAAVLADHVGNVWVGTKGGLDKLNPSTGKFTHYQSSEDDPTSLSNNEVRALYEDHDGTLWIGTGLYWEGGNDGGLNRFDRESGTFTRYLHDPNNPQSLISSKVSSLFEDSRGNFWVGTNGDGLHSLDRKTGLFTRHTYDPSDPEKLSRPPTKSFDNINFITEDAAGNLWIGTESAGVLRYDFTRKQKTHFYRDSDGSGFTEGSSWSGFASKNGLVWVGTQNERLLVGDMHHQEIPLLEEGITAFFQESPAVAWIGTRKGLVRKDSGHGTSQLYRHVPGIESSISSNFIQKIFKDHVGVFWIGTRSGLNRYEPEKGIFQRYMHNPDDSSTISANDIRAIAEVGDDLWIGTYGGGLEKFNRDNGQFTHFRNYFKDPTNMNEISCLVKDHNDMLWIGAFGVIRYDTKAGTYRRYLTGSIISDILEDAKGTVWVGAGDGLFRYNEKADQFDNMEIESRVYAIIDDDENNIWLATQHGLVKINSAGTHTIQYKMKVNAFFQAKAFKNFRGEVIMSREDLHYAFDPAKIRIPDDTSAIYVTDFWLNDELVTPAKNGLLPNSIFETRSISLNHYQNDFSIAVANIDFRIEGNNIVRYNLEGYDNHWREMNSGDRANYFKVPPGNYVFHIRASNSVSGIVSEKSLSIIVFPPWWKTWWAYTLYSLMVLASVYFADRFQRKRLLEKANARAKERELQQAREIQKAYAELKAAQNQLVQSEKMASLGELTAGIAHEIQNPLNFVNNFSEVNSELTDELKEEARKGNIDGVLAIATDIHNNQLKINHHGRRADAIVRGMLQHSRSSNGIREPTDINALCDEYLRLCYHGFRAKDKLFNAKTETNWDMSLGTINIVSQDVGRVILNLINNAFYAVHEKSKLNIPNYEPMVIVTTRKESGKSLISVKDNGNGIPQDIVGKIFQPFFTTKPAGQGTGLGLSLSYDIVKTHGGELAVETKVGQGSEFIISLPTS